MRRITITFFDKRFCKFLFKFNPVLYFEREIVPGNECCEVSSLSHKRFPDSNSETFFNETSPPYKVGLQHKTKSRY